MKCPTCENQIRTIHESVDHIVKSMLKKKKPTQSCVCNLNAKYHKPTIGYWNEIMNEFQWIDYTNELRGKRK